MSDPQNPIHDWRLWGWVLAALVSGLILGAAPETQSDRLAQTNVETALISRD
jgi:hypothetical protein